ncbi:MAG TPA: TonB-dependent receptor [Sulfurovum sp.]|jgi:outer membrane receptor protein involved in Fe transport|nr:MAG: TonB-dependent receptor [Sulfurovum sp. 35-42-20]OYZ25898.1 MAG: TonB-dependent receptor [Sulfurovum sp. 16-42-52]OYZ48743.1 MAG: TonB-dependent receptor [Sulfurovum sp. 24-42-9]OZA46787.1 MAG: TonB-dependent receptor [Sulfurovum sp. 17-42-90]OZA60015.1 MAG: TonB-dependent receptor [Sulfurovum sp. 39-42-12]HQR73499.1 TonB-dependent receptor [Sulfurovum sp.]
MKSNILTGSIIAAYALLNTISFAQEVNLDPIVVGADFREQNLSKTTNSVTVIGEDEIYDKATQSFIEALQSAPNVNFTAGASKAKYIQIRGIGERSQFGTTMNPSVGVILDGIDLSQSPLGMTLFDVKQIEVLRGPQGTTFGANALAGMVIAQSNQPTSEASGHAEITVGNYNTKAFGAAVGGTIIEDTLLGRVSVYKNSSDGYMDNSYLGREDTNGIDELSVKGALKWLVSDNHTIDFNLLHADIDNGYDAFTLDNSWDSHSDMPGRDTQLTDAFSVKSTYQVNESMHLVTAISHSVTDSLYSYDEDWSYVGEFDASLYPYQGFDSYARDKKQTDFDIRLVSDEAGKLLDGTTAWTVGAYYKDYSENLTQNTLDYVDPSIYNLFTHDYNTISKAIYAQTDSDLTDKLVFTLGVRAESWEVEYDDSNAFKQNTDENLFGGKIGLSYEAQSNVLYYTTLSKGYKPGGVNAGNEVPVADRVYQTETLWNLDVGVNSNYFDNTLINRFNLFYGKRQDQQVKPYLELEKSFTSYFDNAAKGSYYGLESELDYYPLETLHLYTKLGLLHAEFDEYTPEMTGRAPAQSPAYQYNVGFDYDFIENWRFRTNVIGMGSYYFSDTHDSKSDPYALLNSSLEYLHGDFTVILWGRNLTDTEYEVRGFYFGNNPANGYESEVYTQKGTPLTAGVTLSYDF